MRIITITCPTCGTIVAANELENNRVMKCPGFGCQTILRFDDLKKADQEHFLEFRDKYKI